MNDVLSGSSVPSPLHQARNTTSYCYRPPYRLPAVKDLLGCPAIHENLLSAARRTCIQICFLYYCRITELLSVLSTDVLNPDRVLLRGAKGSNSYVIYLPGLSASLEPFKGVSYPFRLFQFTYIQLYRDCVKAGIVHTVPGSLNKRRLHSARYIFAQNGIDKMTQSDLSQCLRHRSTTSLQFYL